MTAERHLPGDVWCLACQHDHIAGIPSVTWRCTGEDPDTAGCGFGAWSPEVAADHADGYPAHVVYPVHHTAVEHPGPRPVLAQDDDGYPCLPEGWSRIIAAPDGSIAAAWDAAGAFHLWEHPETVLDAITAAMEAHG